MARELSAKIIGIGKYLPTKVLTNQDFEKIVDTTDEWIFTRTGIKERRIANAEEFTSTMGIEAAKKAIDNAKIKSEKIDFIIVATATPDYLVNCTAALIQSALGLTSIGAVDIQAACSGFLYGLAIAKGLVETGLYKNILLIASEKMSSFVDYTDRTTCILFGDGAAAAVISSEGAGLTIGAVNLGAEGKYSDLITVPAGGARCPASKESVDQKQHCFKMRGQEVFKLAVRNMSASSQKCLEQMELQSGDITWVIPHQANLRIIDAVGKALNIPDNKIYKTVEKYGNTSASSIPIALDELLSSKSLSKGDTILVTAFGAGLTWGAAILTKN